jgi:hypothetical protein
MDLISGIGQQGGVTTQPVGQPVPANPATPAAPFNYNAPLLNGGQTAQPFNYSAPLIGGQAAPGTPAAGADHPFLRKIGAAGYPDLKGFGGLLQKIARQRYGGV